MSEPTLGLLLATLTLSACAMQGDEGRGQWPPTVAAGDAVAFPATFDRIASYVAISDSTGFAADPTARRLVAVNWVDGSTRDLVRDGDGPGEVRSISQLVPAPDGAALLDLRQRQLMRLRLDGTVAEELRLDSLPLGVSLRGADAAGRYYFEWRGIQKAAVPDSAYILRWPAGRAVDTGGRVLAAPMHSLELIRGTSRNTMMFAGPYAPLDLWAASTDGSIAVLRSDSSRLVVTDAAGSQTVGPVLAPPQIALSQADRDSAPMPDELRAKVVWPEALPSFSGQLRWCQNSNLLLAPRSTGVDSLPSILLLESTGRPLGVMSLDRDERIVGCDATYIYTALSDPEGLDHLRRRPGT